MAWATRSLCTVLAVLLVLAGGVVDLCACDAGSHGAFCTDEAVASCHDERAAAPVEAHGCCSSAPAAPAEALTAAGCGCPVIVLEQPPSESPVASTAAGDATSDLGAASVALATGWVVPEGDAPCDEPWRRPPRPPALRRHLELHVLRC
jgi:hypothetical protein